MMNMVRKWSFLMFVCVALAACTQNASDAQNTNEDVAGLPNPASVYCQEQGYTLEIRTAEDGSQSGLCHFPDGSECDEWAYFRGECAPASQNDDGSLVYIVMIIVVLAIIAILVFVVRRDQRPSRLTPLSGLAFAFVLAGLFFGEERFIGYGLMGFGVILAIVDIIRSMRK